MRIIIYHLYWWLSNLQLKRSTSTGDDEYFNRLHILRNHSAHEKRRGAELIVLKKGGDEGCGHMHDDAAKDLFEEGLCGYLMIRIKEFDVIVR